MQDLSHSMVHYLLTIHKLKEERGYARVTDIAKELKLTKGSVSTGLINLKKKQLVKEDQDSKMLSLSAKGHEVVHHILGTRTLLYYFLKDFLGVNQKVAENDACLMEHLMSAESRVKFFEFMKAIDGRPDLPYNTSLNIKSFKTPDEFINAQKGDVHLNNEIQK